MDIMDTQYYVYELIDPRNGEVFYVGKGNGDRMYHHRKQAFRKKGFKINPHRSRRICKIINEGYNIVYKKYECESEQVAFDKERELISKYGKRCDGTGSLTNLTDGGEGYTGGHIPVCQYDLFGNFIKRHRSAKDAAIELGKKNATTITAVCGGGPRGEVAAFGYLWAYEGELPRLRQKIKPVFQWTLNGEFVNKYPSASDAARVLNCDPSNIPNAIKRGGHSQGFIWSHRNAFPGKVKNKKIRPVRHINTGQIFESVSAAAVAFGHNVGLSLIHI